MSQGRAKTEVQKAEVLFRLEQLWKTADRHHLRLGQLIGNVIRDENTLYNIEDFDLIKKLEDFYTGNLEGGEKINE